VIKMDINKRALGVIIALGDLLAAIWFNINEK
jgi:hypothetical protein